MSNPKRQRTIHPTLRDRATGETLWASLTITRTRVALNPSVCTADPDSDAGRRLEERAVRLAGLLMRRWFPAAGERGEAGR